LHGHGLGVLAVGERPPTAIIALCELTDPTAIAMVRTRFARLGERWLVDTRERMLLHDIERRSVAAAQAEQENARLRDRAAQAEQENASLRPRAAQAEQENASLRARAAQAEQEDARLRARAAQAEEENESLRSRAAQAEQENASLRARAAQAEGNLARVRAEADEAAALREQEAARLRVRRVTVALAPSRPNTSQQGWSWHWRRCGPSATPCSHRPFGAQLGLCALLAGASLTDCAG
jgi:O-antigen biosynthesis protein